MEWIQYWLNSTSVLVFTAFLLGLLTVLSPCPLAINVTAVGYISKDIEGKQQVLWNGLFCTLGRIVSYMLLGVVLIYLLREGACAFDIQKAISHYGEILLLFLLILACLFCSRIN